MVKNGKNNSLTRKKIGRICSRRWPELCFCMHVQLLDGNAKLLTSVNLVKRRFCEETIQF